MNQDQQPESSSSAEVDTSKEVPALHLTGLMKIFMVMCVHTYKQEIVVQDILSPDTMLKTIYGLHAKSVSMALALTTAIATQYAGPLKCCDSRSKEDCIYHHLPWWYGLPKPQE